MVKIPRLFVKLECRKIDSEVHFSVPCVPRQLLIVVKNKLSIIYH